MQTGTGSIFYSEIDNVVKQMYSFCVGIVTNMVYILVVEQGGIIHGAHTNPEENVIE